MEGFEDKIIGGDSSRITDAGKIISGESAGSGSGKILSSNDSSITSADTVQSITELISKSTRQGGLKAIPDDFEEGNGSWSSINSTNPFEQLYLDYKQYKLISDEMVQRNYEILHNFWKNKFLLLNGVTRERIKTRYGESVVNKALQMLDLALQRLKTDEGRLLYFKERNNERLKTGLDAIREFLKFAISDGTLTESTARMLIQEGHKNGLHDYETEAFILNFLREKDFKPRAVQVSANPFKNQWMTEQAYLDFKKRRVTEVEWLGETATSLQEIGKITFQRKPQDSILQRSIGFLPTLVSNLEGSATKAAEFQEIIEEEDEEKRYLKVLYHLDSELPFRFNGDQYDNISSLLNDACQTSDTFFAAIDLFSKGHLDIWMNEASPDMVKLSSHNKNHLGFLKFLYAVNWKFPFFFGNKKYESPEALIQEARVNHSIWLPISKAMENGSLPVWFDALGRPELSFNYNAGVEKIINSGLYHGEEVRLGAAQTLLTVIDRSIPNPQINSNVISINRPNIEGKGITLLKIKLNLINSGFVKVSAKPDLIINGISLDKTELTFNSLHTNNQENEITLSVDSSQLVKDQFYKFNLIITSVYHTLTIPVEIRLIFPKKAYILKLVQYSLISACYFGGFRYLLGTVLNHDGWLLASGSNSSYTDFIGRSPLSSFFVFALFILGCIFSFKLIKKYEKI